MPMHAINLFGSPETITRKLEVLFDHCKRIGRNYDTILKTKLSHVIIAKDREEAERRVNERFGEMEKESRREFVIYGNPAEVLEQILIFKDIGIKLSNCQLRAKERNANARNFY
jgi:alkanesulfonate monooxygenase SsuD/methylene tetrahydromethanopterin reductase-like flavin-dependent oxidoreductase (luciferase family)